MDFLKNAASSVTKAVNFVVDKNRRTAMMNRLKIVIKNEKESQARAYIQLGKYYYQNMRDADNSETEPLCSIVDNTGMRLKRAYAKLDQLAVPSNACGCECGCGCGEQDENPESAYEDEEPETEAEQTQPAPDEEVPKPDESFFQPDMDASQQESADDDEEFLRPFSVVPNVSDPTENATDETPENKKE